MTAIYALCGGNSNRGSWGISANGNTLVLQARIKGSIPLSSTSIVERIMSGVAIPWRRVAGILNDRVQRDLSKSKGI